MAQSVWHDSTKHYSLAEKTHPKDRIDLEIGDSQDSAYFHPQMKMLRWDNEANVSFRLNHAFVGGNVQFGETDGVITWEKGAGANKWIARFYEDWSTDDGAYKFLELVIPNKPLTNQISFTVVSKDVNFFYQPFLTQEQIDDGDKRPENVEGSYAIYHSTKGVLNDSSGKEYKAGKVGHLYRARLIDANNNESWAEYNTDLNETGILTITMDQNWLDSATYPITLDPTFGYTTEGGSLKSICTKDGTNYYTTRAGDNFVGVAGTLDDLRVSLSISTNDASVDVYTAINEKDSIAANSHGEIAFIEQNLSLTTTKTWFTFTATSESLSAVDYILSTCFDARDFAGNYAGYVSYDVAVVGNHYLEYFGATSSAYDNSKEDPWTVSVSPNAEVFSIYATYTPDVTTGDTYWGHVTGVTETNVRTFVNNWTGTAIIVGEGDSEKMCISAGESMFSEIVNTNTGTVEVVQNVYDVTGDDVTLSYRHSGTVAACQNASWVTYSVPFTSLGYVQLRATPS